MPKIIQVIPDKLLYYRLFKCGNTTINGWIELINDDGVYKEIEAIAKVNNEKISDMSMEFSTYNGAVDRAMLKRKSPIQRRIIKRLQHLEIPRRQKKGASTKSFCVIRDPLSRFYSAYTHLVMRHNVFGKYISVEEFIRGIKTKTSDREMAWKKAISHTNPIVQSIGRDPNVFSDIFNINEMDKVKKYMEEKSGKSLPKFHFNSNKVEKYETSKIIEEFVKKRYAEDYKVYGKWM